MSIGEWGRRAIWLFFYAAGIVAWGVLVGWESAVPVGAVVAGLGLIVVSAIHDSGAPRRRGRAITLTAVDSTTPEAPDAVLLPRRV